ncbi:MAG: Ig-like domain-containing protein [Bifidobacteriaceae bacterium]|nr:Ig-like domain-containing protein [Bifidobacteriaceae bacterium]
MKAGQSAVALVRGKSVTVPVAVYFADRVASYSGALVWKSSNPRIAKVSSTGKITAVRAGKATVTATSKAVNGAGKKVSVKIRVAVVSVRPAVKATRVVAKVPKSLNVGQVAYVTGSYRSAKATGVKVSYKSSRPDVATVDKTGRITANSPGKTTLTVKAGPIAKKYTITTK